MDLGVGSYFDMEPVARMLADERDQLRRITEIADLDHARGHVAAQGDNMPDAVGLVFIEDRCDALARTANAGEVRRGVETIALDFEHCRQGAVAGGAAGAECHREKARLQLLQLTLGDAQLLLPFGRLGWKEFATEDTLFIAHLFSPPWRPGSTVASAHEKTL